MKFRVVFFFLLAATFFGCKEVHLKNAPTIGFMDAFEDATMQKAKQGFYDAMEKNGFSEKDTTINIIYKNAQGNIPTLVQIVQYFKEQRVKAIVACPSIATIAAMQNTVDVPVFMMVSPEPEILHLELEPYRKLDFLHGVGESLDYIDTSFLMIKKLVTPKSGKLKVGMIFNQSEPQSVNALKKIESIALAGNMEVIALPVNNSSELQMVTKSLTEKNIDAFFANPDNTVFAGFEVILNSCNTKNIPVFTSEAGLVDRGAVAAYGADLYQWGYQCGELVSRYLKGETDNSKLYEKVAKRVKVYNAEACKRMNITVDSSFQLIK